MMTATLAGLDKTSLNSEAPPAPIAVSVTQLSKRFAVRRKWEDVLRHPWRFSYTQALDAVGCEVRRGEFFGLLGPNGAGKTTLFKILATLITPDRGRATVEGFDIVEHGEAVRRVLMPVVADERSLRWRLSAWENLRLFAVLYGIPSSQVRSRVDSVLQTVGLADTDGKLVGQFSSGMRQRLLIARALLARPRVLLLDEPTRSLDPISARDLRIFLREEVCQRQGCTVLLATHNTEEALELCDRVGILDHGRLLMVGPPQRLIREQGDEWYVVSTNTTRDAVFRALVHEALVDEVIDDGLGEDGWSRQRLRIPGGPSAVARVTERLVQQRVMVASVERRPLTLAELIERVVARAREAPDA